MFKNKLASQTLAFVLILAASAALYPAAQSDHSLLTLGLLAALVAAQTLLLLTG